MTFLYRNIALFNWCCLGYCLFGSILTYSYDSTLQYNQGDEHSNHFCTIIADYTKLHLHYFYSSVVLKANLLLLYNVHFPNCLDNLVLPVCRQSHNCDTLFLTSYKHRLQLFTSAVGNSEHLYALYSLE